MRYAWATTTARFLLVSIGIIALTSFTIDATDSLRGSQTALSALADRWLAVDCRDGTVPVSHQGETLCVDVFVASPGLGCPHRMPHNSFTTTENLNTAGCEPRSVAQAVPWTWIAQHQAAALCARAGKRLPTAAEWYAAALGTPDSNECNTHSNQVRQTSRSGCVSGAGVYDMIGNVWEFVSGEVVDQHYADQRLPASGYVAGISSDGLPTASANEPVALFNADYIWTHASGTRVLMRGGYHGSRDDAGLYTVHAAVDPVFFSGAIGFRCVYTKS